MKGKVFFILFSILLGTTFQSQAQSTSLIQQINDYTQNKNATIGVALLTDDGKAVCYNAHIHYPLLSVFKIHVALAALNKMNKQQTNPDSLLYIQASQLKTDTYSPLQQQVPNQDFQISLKVLLKYSLSLSDNNACDLLIDYAGGIQAVAQYIRSIGIRQFQITETEASMHVTPLKQYSNWSTLSEIVNILQLIDKRVLFSPIYNDLLWEALTETQTGPDKLKGKLPDNLTIGHKTGSSNRMKGMKIADNDAGIIVLPDGKRYCLAIFIMDSYETDDNNAAIIADISRMIYDWFLLSHNDQ